MTKTALALLAGCCLSLAAAMAQSDPAQTSGEAAETITAQSGATDKAAAQDSGQDSPLPADSDARSETPNTEPAKAARNLRVATYERMVRLLKEKRYGEAKEAAQAVVTMTEQESGPDSIKIVPPLDNLATTQMLNGDLIDAANNYQRSIAIIKQAEGRLTPRLVNPYVGLGATYNRAELYEKAEEAYLTALRINHVNDGFYNLEQIRIRDGLTEAFIGLDDFGEADFHQTIQLEINQRRYGEDNPEVAPAMYKLARWYERAGLMEEARYIYQRAQSVIRKSAGKNSPEMVAALEGMAGTYERQGLLGESAGRLKRALKIVESQPEIDRPKQAELLVRLGDLFMGAGQRDTANANYERAWQALSQDPEYSDLRQLYFSNPVRVAGLGWSVLRYGPGVRGNAPDLLEGFVLVRYDVATDGRTENVTIIESDPQDLMDKRVKSAIKRSYFRPRYSDGVAAVAEGQLYRHDFRYRPEPPEKRKKDSKPLKPPTGGGSGRIDYPNAGDG
ncbi:MAG: TonB family protein [Gammaproteobacteria bacterium]